MNQIYKQFIRIIIFFSNCFFYASDQEKKYEILFSEESSYGEIIPFIKPIILAQSQVDQIQLIKDLIELESGSQKINESISVVVEDDSLKETITKTFEHVYLPVVTEFIKIKDKKEDHYFKIISLIAFIKNHYNSMYDYEILKNILNMGEYLQAPLIVKRAFANVCYDLKPDYLTQKTNEAFSNDSYTNEGYKEVYETFEKNEKDVIRNDLLISLNDLPKKFVKADDFINKGLRSLDGIKKIIQSEYNRYRARYVFYQKIFNFNQNFIQEIDSLSVLTNQLERENIRQCRFIVNLRQQKLSEKAKEECKKINQFINRSSFKDRFENLTESDLMPDPWMNVKIEISHLLQSPRTSFAGLFAYTGLYTFFAWKFHTFASNQIMYMGKQILSPSLFKKFEKIPLKALPLTLFMTRFTFRPYYNIRGIFSELIKKILRFKQIVYPDELELLPNISLYILYDK